MDNLDDKSQTVKWEIKIQRNIFIQWDYETLDSTMELISPFDTARDLKIPNNNILKLSMWDFDDNMINEQ